MNNMKTKKDNKFLEFFNKWGMVIMVALILLSTFKACDTNSDVSRLRKDNSRLEKTVDSLKAVTTTEKQVRDNMEKVMLDFLIYEDELDGKKITISQIKDKIKSND